jgi:hypothetical protein
MKNAESMINQWKQRFGKINKTKRYISTTATPHPPKSILSPQTMAVSEISSTPFFPWCVTETGSFE